MSTKCLWPDWSPCNWRHKVWKVHIDNLATLVQDSEVAKRDAEDRVLKLQQGSDKTKVIS